MWYITRFSIDQKNIPSSQAHVDLALLDITIAPLITKLSDSITAWRVHRRFGDDATGHEFSFQCYCLDHSVGSKALEALKTDSLVQELQQARTVVKVDNDTAGPSIMETNDPAWPQEIQKTWPMFAQSLSELQLHLVELYRFKSQGMPDRDIVTNWSLLDKLRLYQGIQAQIDTLWFNQGSHAFIHHLHTFFAYHRFRGTVNGITGVIEDIR